jgi:hypothetical protein
VRHVLRRKTSTRFWFKFWEFILLFPVYPFYFIEKIILKLDSTWSWFITASIVATLETIINKPAIIYSTGGPVSAHIAAMIAARITKTPYIAEFQDPLVHQYAAPGKFERHFIKKVEKLIFRTADTVIFLTQQAAKNAFERNNNSNKAFALYAGAVPFQGSVPYVRSDILHIAHFGSLGGSRNLNCFLHAWSALLDEKPDMAASLHLDLYGSNKKNLNRQKEKFKYKQTIHVHGKLKRQEAVFFMRTTDVLLLIQNTDDVSFETIPSKVFEYLHTKRPIFALLYRNHELQNMLEAMGHTVVQADDEDAIKKGLETYLAQWKQSRLQSSALESPYTTKHAVDELIQLANRSLNGRMS